MGFSLILLLKLLDYRHYSTGHYWNNLQGCILDSKYHPPYFAGCFWNLTLFFLQKPVDRSSWVFLSRTEMQKIDENQVVDSKALTPQFAGYLMYLIFY